ncbi:glycoside hydrolase/deacetylase [Piromyces finnis]|uniref:Glycoside hydrolase/deacetylase n=1 Tax=Piromyces finnis TaxID=1754191 RepID=A0A1Y1VEM5_9FUNG|nr:glycoside hydrolase/deacetylase [Piromyces finnis]|eukprot:ORX52962.1 glycoside hydrolase/deacetylase [Piromyces finnis]
MRLTSFISLGLSAVISANAVRIESCTEPNTVALTFDDGPYQYTNDLLDTLKAANIHATFFINGDNYWPELSSSQEKQEVLKRAAAEGHQIASHTWKHEIPLQDDDTIDKQATLESLSLIEDLVFRNVGKYPTYFRAPLGSISKETVELFEEYNYKVIQWDTDTNDWNREVHGVKSDNFDNRVKAVKEFLTEEYKEKRENYLVLMHDVQPHTVKTIVPFIIENGLFKEYKFVTVAECLGDPTGGWSKAGNALTVLSGGNPLDNKNDIIQGNSTISDPQGGNLTSIDTGSRSIPDNDESMDLKSGSIANAINFYVIVTFLVSTLYMFF